MPGPTALRTVHAAVISASGNTGPLLSPWGATTFAVTPSVTAYTSGTITYEVQWSFDGVNFFSADPKDTFSNLTSTAMPVKIVTSKAPYYRVTWTTGSFTHNIQDSPVAVANTASASSYDQGPGALGAVLTAFIPSKTYTGTFVQGTTATYSAILAVPAGWGRMAVKMNVTAFTGTTPVGEIMWSFNGTTLLHGDPADTFTATAGTGSVIKELAVKAPFVAFSFTSGTATSVTVNCDVLQSAA